MWNRLKNSLTAAALSAVIMIAAGVVADPATPDSPQVDNDAALFQLSAGERTAYLLAVQLTALAIDAALEPKAEGIAEAAAKTVVEAARHRPSAHSLRMPFYSFAKRLPRAQES